jgi:hypothetical protein
MRGTLNDVSPLIIVIARRDSRGREHDLGVELLSDVHRERRAPALLPASRELPSWYEHEEDD